MDYIKVYSGTTLVGTSSLEFGDPPMGIAFGRLVPLQGYAAIQAECRTNHHDQSGLQLSVRTTSGELIQCASVAILEGGGDIEVNVLGISHPSYADLFPQHVERYEAQSK